MDERWEVFHNAPTDWKKHGLYIVYFESEKLLNGEICWSDDFYIVRNETINMETFIEMLCEQEYSDEIINAFKEEILSKNLGSFVYDW